MGKKLKIISMINKTFLKKLKKDYTDYNSERRQIIALANIILHDSKRVIFALHRGDIKLGEEKLLEIEKLIKKLDKQFGYKRVNQEGSYRAGVEEYVEAKMFYFVLTGSKINKIKDIKLAYESYLGGICDTTGELVRKAVNEAARGNTQEVVKMKEIISDILAELVEFDMTGYLRTKYDQARGNLRKIEQVNYEVSLRNK